MTAWLAKVDPMTKVAVALVGLGILLAAYRGLPAQVKENTAAIITIDAKMDDVFCMLLIPDVRIEERLSCLVRGIDE